MKTFHIQLSAIIFIACLGVIDYSNSFHNSFHFDDFPDLVNNSAIRNIHDIQAIWNCLPTRFVNFFSLALNYHWGNLNVFGYHVFNLSIHLASSILVWWLVILTLKSGYTRWMAFFTGLIFLTHPLQTQPVNYIVQRATLLVAFFYLASLVLYTKARLIQQQNNRSQIWKIYYVASLLTTVMCMFSKETAISLPLMICCYEFCFLTNSKGFNWKIVAPFIALILIIPLMIMPMRLNGFTEAQQTVHDFSGGIGPIQYFLTQLRVKVTYLRLLFLPFGQSVEYNYTLSKSLFEIPVIFSGLFLFFILYGAIRMFNKFKLIAFSIFWFFITLLPESSFWPNRDLIFEHRLYLPMVGFGLFVTSGLFYIFGQKRINFVVGVLSLLVIGYSVLTYNRNKVWLNEFTLWDDAVHQAPEVARPHLNRGAAYQNQGNPDKAMADYTRALEINPRDFVTYSNLGMIYMDRADYDRAIFDFNQAIMIDAGYAGAFNNRGRVYDKKGDFDKAIADYSKAIKIKPDYAGAYSNRGMVYEEQGKLDDAIADYNQAIKINPDYAEAYNNRAVTYHKMGHSDQSLIDYNKAIVINPAYAAVYVNRGIIYEDKRKLKETFRDFDEAIRIDPGFAIAYYDRAALNQKLGNLDQAISDYSKAIELKKNYTGAYNNRGVVYSLKGQFDKAFDDYNKALTIDPHFTAAQSNLEYLAKIRNSK